MTRRILRNLKLTHIAAVDFPAQEPARALLIKRAPDPEPEVRPASAVAKAHGDFMAKVGEIQTRDKISRHQAMSKARSEFPSLFAAMQAPVALTKVEPSAAEVKKVTARASFAELARDLADRDRIALPAAMSLARKRYPAEFAAAYG